MTCSHCVGAADLFGERQAKRDLRRLRRHGPGRPTRRLLEDLKARSVVGASVMDVGGGVGALQLGLLEAGAARALNVDASPAYQEAARDEARTRGLTGKLTYRTGDVVDLAPDIEPHDVVTLDRVLCCYPDVAALVDATAALAVRLWGAVLPRETWYMRLWMGVINAFQRLRRHPFRVYVHDVAAVRERLAGHGFRIVRESRTTCWEVWLFERRREGNP
jgi:magnesium-protoporphyrin O-methyltransferase